MGALGAEEDGGTVEEREVFALLRSDPSSVTAFAVPPSPMGKALGCGGGRRGVALGRGDSGKAGRYGIL